MTKILYVEDNDDNIFMLKMRLERKGYEVVIARDGEEGVTKASSESPDIILMDVGLPKIDGYEATRQLKSGESTKGIPIIMLTAHALTSDQEKAIQAGADDYAAKPVNFKKLLEQMDALLQKDGHKE